MSKVLILIAPKDFRDEEFQESFDACKNAGFDVTVASLTTDVCVGMFGVRVTPDCGIDEVDASQFDAIIVVGGSGTPVLKQYPKVLQIIQNAAAQNKILAAICLGPIVFAKAGVLRGKRATVFSSGVSEIKSGGAEYVPEPVVIDGNLITADGPDAAARFGETVVKALTNKS
ncbi:MAG: DJ-1/PfpI family protein [Methanosarcinales archaeon]|nr:MAG: DJ-1/PfpI family protein [Methanosarcinales archaeon]